LATDELFFPFGRQRLGVDLDYTITRFRIGTEVPSDCAGLDTEVQTQSRFLAPFDVRCDAAIW